ncbi:MAG: hypothetical protein R3Y49_07015 [Rikenellaceae bacterium]
MKKTLFILFSAFALLLIGCDTTKEEINSESSLVGTNWATNQTIDTGVGIELELSIDLFLLSDSKFTCSIAFAFVGSSIPGVDFSDINQDVTGTWSYSEPYLSLEVEGETIRCELKDDKLYFEEGLEIMDDYSFEIVLTKQ